MKPVTLSKRMRAVTEMVTAGSRVCDVGCDHGFVSIYLVEQGISPGALAMDVRTGPLGAAKAHVAERNLDDVIETRLSDGLHNYKIGEADILVCAGMGGGLMRRILTDEPDKTRSFRELILQPQSEVEQFRAWLREAGYRIVGENMIEEEGKFYPMMRVSYAGEAGMRCAAADAVCMLQASKEDPLQAFPQSEIENSELCKLQDRYGPILLAEKNQTLKKYLQRETVIFKRILDELSLQGLSDSHRSSRYSQIQELLEDCQSALRMVDQKGEGEATYDYSQDQWGRKTV